MKRGPGRPPHPDVLTPAEWRVLEQLRAGKANAEIAVRLGVSVNTVKYHVANILGKLGVADREAAAAWDGAPRRVRVLAPLAWLVGRVGWSTAGVAGVGVVVVVVALIGGGSCAGSRGLVTATVEPTLAVAAPTEVTSTPVVVVVVATEVAGASEVAAAGLPFEQEAGYRGYESAELVAAGFVDTGAFLRVPGNPYPVAESSYRAGFTGVRVADAGVVSVEVAGIWSFGVIPGVAESTQAGITLAGDAGSGRMQLTLSGESGTLQRMPQGQAIPAPTRVMRVGTDGATFYLDGGGPDDRRPQLIIDVGDAEGRSYPVIIDRSGHLWVRPTPLDGRPVVLTTGEAPGVSAQTLNSWAVPSSGRVHESWCPTGSGCFTIIESAVGLPAPADGVLSCIERTPGSRAFLVETGRYRIEYAPLPPLTVEEPVSCADDEPRQVTEREVLSEQMRWWVRATDVDGNVAHVVAGGEFGFEYWIGVDAPTITECPPCIGPETGD